MKESETFHQLYDEDDAFIARGKERPNIMTSEKLSTGMARMRTHSSARFEKNEQTFISIFFR